MAAEPASLPHISIVVPSFNQGHYLQETFDSIFCQDYPHLEIVVMDGGSTDNSVDIIRSHAHRVKYWQSQPDGGQSAAINAGVQRCTGDLVTWLNSDDYYWRDCLWTIGRAYAEYPGHGLYIGNGFRLDQREKRLSPFCPRHIALNRAALIQGGDYLLQPSTFVLREAWNAIQGLKPDLHYCMDWDLFIRIAARYPAVLINEFLAVSREYEETKSRGGKLKRALELVHMIQGHSHQEVTPGTLCYLFATLLGVSSGKMRADLAPHLSEACLALGQHMGLRYGWGSGWPEESDAQDRTYLPIAGRSSITSVQSDPGDCPSLSIVLTAFHHGQYLEQALESVLAQAYPKLEIIVVNNATGSQFEDIRARYGSQVSSWVSERFHGPAQAINAGLRKATGDVVTWLDARDLMTCDALESVGRAFAETPELDFLYGNALLLNAQNSVQPIANDLYRTAFLYGESESGHTGAAYWSSSYRLPQPPMYFRRMLLDQLGLLNESYRIHYDREFHGRLGHAVAVQKLERTLILSRMTDGRWQPQGPEALAELYRMSRPLWPRFWSAGFRATYRDFVEKCLRPRLEPQPAGLTRWGRGLLARLSALTGIGNPEHLLPAPQEPAIPHPLASAFCQAHGEQPQVAIDSRAWTVTPAQRPYHSLCCFPRWPDPSAQSESEIRDFHFVRRLLSVSSVEFFAVQANVLDGNPGALASGLDVLHSPETIRLIHPDWVRPNVGREKLRGRLINWLRRAGVPVAGPRYHLDVMEQVPHFLMYCQRALQGWVNQGPDFLFVGSQNNPAALFLDAAPVSTRLILVAHEIETRRVQQLAHKRRGLARLALSLEAKRARRFEMDNLSRYDGVIVASEEDRQILLGEYAVPADRTLVIASGANRSEWDVNLARLDDWLPQLIALGRRQVRPAPTFSSVCSARIGTTRLSA